MLFVTACLHAYASFFDVNILPSGNCYHDWNIRDGFYPNITRCAPKTPGEVPQGASPQQEAPVIESRSHKESGVSK